MNKTRLIRISYAFSTLIASTLLMGCDEEDSAPPDSYSFESRFQEGESSVSYSGQIFRHVLIKDLVEMVEDLDEEIVSDADFDPSTVEERLLSYYEFDSDLTGNNKIRLSTDLEKLQETFDDISPTTKNLMGKIAGQDSGGEKDHKDWSKDFVGFSDDALAEFGGNVKSPDGLVRAIFAQLQHNAELQSAGDESRDGLKTHQTASGLDLAELLEKFLLGAVAFAQASDDYLDEGLEADNSEADEDKSYTALEHAWDEGFGYFGASRTLLDQSDEEIANGEILDSDKDGKVDLKTEYNFAIPVYCAKRDLGSESGTDFTSEVMEAFILGRHLIATEAALDEIREQAQIALMTWEKAAAATTIHYMNDIIASYGDYDSDDFDFDGHAAHWSEMKGFALGFQFNPRSALSDEDFEELHGLIGNAPKLPEGEDAATEVDDYVDSLVKARDLLRDGYGFDEEDTKNW